VVLILFVLSTSFPPWVKTYSGNGSEKSIIPGGHSFILTPSTRELDGVEFGVQIDWSGLTAEYFIILGLAGIFYVSALMQKPRREA
jgi:hypothetical protein